MLLYLKAAAASVTHVKTSSLVKLCILAATMSCKEPLHWTSSRRDWTKSYLECERSGRVGGRGGGGGHLVRVDMLQQTCRFIRSSRRGGLQQAPPSCITSCSGLFYFYRWITSFTGDTWFRQKLTKVRKRENTRGRGGLVQIHQITSCSEFGFWN